MDNLYVDNYQLNNESNITILADVSELLSKRQNFRFQPSLDNHFKDRLDHNLFNFSYRYRWYNKMKVTDGGINIPFRHNTVTLPPSYLLRLLMTKSN